jgi:hypothetical protein
MENFLHKLSGKMITGSWRLRLTGILLLTSLFCSVNTSAQKYIWAKSTGGSGNDSGSKSVVVDPSGNMYVTGCFQGTVDFDPGAGTANLTSAGGTDIFIAKYDASGNYIWAKKIGGIYDDKANEIILGSSGDLLITGGFQGTNVDFDPGAGVANMSSSGGYDVFYAKYSNSGSYIFANKLGGTYDDMGKSIKEYGGNIYIGGEFKGSADFDPGSGTTWLNAYGSENELFVASFTQTANLINVFPVQGYYIKYLNKLALDAFGNIFITGSFEGDADFDPGWQTGEGTGNPSDYYLYSNGSLDIFLAKYTSTGSMIWAKNMGNEDNDEANDLVIDAEGNPIITGYFGLSVNFGYMGGESSLYLNSNGSSDIFIAKYFGTSGYVYGGFNIGGADIDIGTCVDLDEAGNIVFGGTFAGDVAFNPATYSDTISSLSGNTDIFFAKFSYDLNYINAFRLGDSTDNDLLADIAPNNSNVFFTGFFEGSNVDFNPDTTYAYLNSSNIDIFNAKYLNINPPGIDSLKLVTPDTTSLAFSARLFSLRGDTTINRGFICWEFDESDRFIDDTTVMKINQNGSFGTGTFTATFSGLYPGTNYSVKAYATNSAGTAYSTLMNFRTLYPSPTGHSAYFNISYTPNYDGYWPVTSFDFDYANNTGATGYIILEKFGAPPTSLPVDGVQYYHSGQITATTTAGDTIGDAKIVGVVDYYKDYGYYYENYYTRQDYSECGTYYYKLIPFNWDGTNDETTNYYTNDTIPSGSVYVYLRPEFQYDAPVEITSSSAILSSVLNDGCDTVTERGFLYTDNGNWNPDIYYDNYVSKSGSFTSGTFNDTISGLYPQTQYFYAPYAINNAELNYGNIESFWTLSTEPQYHASYFTATANLSQQSIYLTFPSCSTTQCQQYLILEKMDSEPTGVPQDGMEYYENDYIGDARVARIISYPYQTDDYITNLEIGHVYYYKLIPFNWNGYMTETYNYRISPTIPTASAALPDLPVVALTNEITGKSNSGATVQGEITSTNGANPTIRGICYKISTGNPTTSDSVRFETGSFGTGTYNINLTNLQSQSLYTYRAYATNTAGTAYSNTSNSFRTYSAEPSAYPASFTAITNSTTQIKLQFSAANTIANCDGYYIKMRQDSAPAINPSDGTIQSVGTTNGVEVVCALITNTSSTNTLIGNLNPGNRYYFAIYPFNWDGSNTETYNYRTQPTIPVADAYTIVPATLTTGQPASSAITSTSSDITGNIVSLGSDSISTTRGICYMTYGAGDPTTSNSTNNESGSFTTGSFTRSLTALTAETHYKAAAYANNTVGTGYGNTIDFWTFSNLPAAHAGSFTATAVSTSQIDLTFTAASSITDADGYIILMKQGSLPTSLPVNGMAYSNGTVIGDATVVAFINSTTYTSASVTNLNPGNNYYFKLIPFNWDQTNTQTFNYRTAATIPNANASTIVPPTVVTSSNLANITSTLVDAYGDITSTGATNATNRGFCYMVYTTGDPTTANMVTQSTGSYGTGTYTLNIGVLNNETRYKIRAFATNSAGTGYGSTYDFYTLSAEPSAHAASFTATTVSTTQIDLSFSPASSLTNADGYIILMKQGSAPTSTPVDGIGYATGNVIGDASVAAYVNGTSITSASISGLNTGYTYYFKLIPYNWDLSNTQTFNYRTLVTIPSASALTITAPNVTTSASVDSITSASVYLTGNVTALNGSNVTTRGHLFNVYTSADITLADYQFGETGSYSTGTYTRLLTTLNAETRYKFRAYAVNSAGVGLGANYDFYTLSNEPSSHAGSFTATTNSTTQIELSFSAASTISNADGYFILVRSGSVPTGVPADGTGYSTGSAIGDATLVAIVNNTSTTAITISNLSPSTTYYFSLIPFNWNGSNYQTYNFRTLATIPSANATTIFPPTVNTFSNISNLSSSGVDISGEITSLNGINATTRGICYKVYASGDPTTANSTNPETGSFSTGSFTRSLTGLAAETRYKFRAYAINSTGTGYGNSSYDFYTYSIEPSSHSTSFTATTASITQIDLSFSAASTITNTDGYLVIMKQNSVPTGLPVDGQAYSVANSIGDATVVANVNNSSVTNISINGLSTGNNYYFALIPYNWDQSNTQTYNYRTQTTIPTANASTIMPPTVTTSSVITNISSTGADIAGEIIALNGAGATTRGICYKVYATGDPTTANSSNPETGSFTTGTFSRTLTGLTSETRYKARAYAINTSGTGYGSVSYDFFTLSTEPSSHAASFTANTSTVSQIDLTFSAASTISNADGYLIIMKQGAAPTGTPTDGQAYSTGNSFGDATVVANINSTSITSANISGLSTGYAYYFKLIPYNWDQSNSQTYNYRTLATIPSANATTILPPALTTSSVITNISSNGADISGEITSINGANPTTRGVCYKVSSAGDPTTSNTTNSETGSFSTGTYTRTLTGLTAQTMYKARAYATNTAGTGYGSISYTFYTLSTEPSAHASSFTATTASTSQIDLTFSAASTIANADGYIVIMKQGSAPTGTPNDGQAYNVGNSFGDATVVANVNSTSVTTVSISGLSISYNYYFKLIPFNWDQSNPETYNYRIQATIPTANAYTIMPPAVTTSSAISSIDYSSAIMSGEITSLNGANATTRGICYKIYATGDPTTANSTNLESGTFSLGTYSRTLSGLNAETRYKARAYAINSAGTGYGSISYDFYTLSNEPSTHAVSFTATAASTTQIDLNFSAASSVPYADGYMIIMKQGSAPSSIPTDGQAYSTGTSIGDATIISLISSTSITSTSITGLSTGYTYYFKLIPYNWNSSNSQTYNYRTQATIPTASATTILIPSVITASTFSNISSSGVDVSGNITETNGANATTRGICYKVYATGDPTTSNSTNPEMGSFGTGTYSRTLTGLTPETRYKARAYAINSAGTGYGNSYDFFTYSSEPSSHASTFTATTASTTQIDLSFSPATIITNADGYIILMRQGAIPTNYPGDGQAYANGTIIGNASVAAVITSNTATSASVGNLTPGLTYYFLLIPYNWDLTNTATYNYYLQGTIPNANANTIVPPTVTTSASIANITPSAADVSGNITATGAANSTARGICYKVYGTGDPTTANSVINETGSFSTGSYTKTLTLSSQTHYQARAYATNSAGTGYGSTYDFYSLSSEPVSHPVTFNATVISQYRIKLSFPAPQSISLCNGYIILAASSGYPATDPVDGNSYSVGSHLGGSPYVAAIVGASDTIADLMNLNPATTYFFKIYPFNWDGANSQTTNYRTSATPLTSYAITIVAPGLVTDQTVTNISATTADLYGSITDNGGQNVNQRGFVYKVYATGDPTASDFVSTQSGSYGSGSFSRSLTGLTPETRYKFLAYAYRGTSHYYGPTSHDFYTLSAEPSSHAATFTATTVSTSQIDLSFSAANTISNADGYIVLMRQGTAPTSTPVDGTIYPTSTTLGNATIIGVIYSNSVTSLSVVNLSPGNNYYFSLYPFNWDGTNYQTFNYRTVATVPAANASTIVLPSLTTSPIFNNITTSTVSADGDVTATGGAYVTTRGICYKVYASGDPTTSDYTNPETGSFSSGTFTRNLTGLNPETRYKLRAYAINPAGTGYASSSVDFYTLSPEPASHASFFTATTASVSQIILSFPAASTITDADGYIILMKQGSAITGIPSDAINYSIGSAIGDATVCAIINNTSTANATITSVSTGNTYYFALIPYNWNGSIASTFNYRTQSTIPTAFATTIVSPAVVTSSIISNISTSGADISGDITSTNGTNATQRGICYKVYAAGDPLTTDFVNQEVGSFGTGSFTRSLNSLNPETHFKVRAFATNTAGTGYGLTYDFFTLSNEPLSHAVSFTATTSSTSQIDLSFSAANSITNADGYVIIQRQDAAPTGLPADGQTYSIGSSIGNGTLAAIVSNTTITETSITSVSAGNSYYFILIPFSWDGSNAQTINYRTSGTIPLATASTITVPVLTTSLITNVSTTSSDISGNISNTGGIKPTIRGICYKTNTGGDPLITDIVNQESGLFSTGNFTRTVIGLSPETHYKARAFATNTAGTGYGNTLDFFTLSPEPLSHSNTFTAVSYSSSQIILNFQPANNIMNADGYIIIQSQGSAPNGLPADGNAYSTGNPRGNGIVAAIINDVNQSSITITNLNSGTTYYYSLIPYNWNGSNPETYNYFTGGTIPQANATTLLPCSINASLRIYGPSIVCQGDSVKLEVDYNTSLSYQWTKNNIIIPGASSNVFYASTTGDYKVFINNTTCSVVSSVFSLSNYPVEPPVITSTGNISPCSNDSVMLSTAQYSSYLWSNGKTTQNIWVNVSGNYTVIVTDQYGCKVKSYDFTVNAAAMEPPTICLVTVDSLIGKNMIVWERPETTVIDSYYIYKESTQAGKYYLIGRMPYSDLSVFIDTNSNPTVKADRYRISIVDTCGIESAPSQVHKTMHLTINKGINGENNLIWDYYEGFTFSTYKILRGTNPGNMRPIALIQNNLTSYSDINPPLGLLFYQVVVVKPDPCYPALFRAQTNSGPYSQSASNLKDYSTIGKDYLSAYPSELYIAKEKNSTNSFTVFTSLTSWSAYAADNWIDVIADVANKQVVVVANSDNTNPNPRVTSLIIKYSPIDSLILMVVQKGTVGISDNYNKGISVEVYPNPFTSSTNIDYELSRSTQVSISVYDIFGKLVTPLCNEKQQPGKHIIQFSPDNTGYTEGIYYIIVEADGIRTVKKLIRIN